MEHEEVSEWGSGFQPSSLLTTEHSGWILFKLYLRSSTYNKTNKETKWVCRGLDRIYVAQPRQHLTYSDNSVTDHCFYYTFQGSDFLDIATIEYAIFFPSRTTIAEDVSSRFYRCSWNRNLIKGKKTQVQEVWWWENRSSRNQEKRIQSRGNHE